MLRICFVFLLFLVYINTSFSQEGGLNVYGHFRTDLGVSSIFSNDHVIRYSYFGRNVLRLEFENADTTYGKLEGSVDFNILSGDYRNLLVYTSNAFVIAKDVILSFDIRKLYLMVRFDWFDLLIGRQLMKFGYGIVFSPISFFDKIDLSDVKFSRIGIDAIRFKVLLSEIDSFDVIAIPKVDITNSTFAGRLVFRIFNFEGDSVISYFGDDNYLRCGFALKTDLEIGIYGEFVYNYHNELSNRYFEFVFGADYSLFDKLILRLEYYYNSFTNESLYLLTNPNSYFELGQYVMVQITYSFDLFSSLNLSLIKDLEYEGFWITLSYGKNLFQDVNFVLDIRFLNGNMISFLPISDFGYLSVSSGLELRF
ncbi:MAG: hypothetical protein ACK4F9_01880 [Brevinematia bacterium]